MPPDPLLALPNPVSASTVRTIRRWRQAELIGVITHRQSNGNAGIGISS